MEVGTKSGFMNISGKIPPPLHLVHGRLTDVCWFLRLEIRRTEGTSGPYLWKEIENRNRLSRLNFLNKRRRCLPMAGG